jgi:hypothetical protein
LEEIFIRFNPLSIDIVPIYKTLLEKGVYIYDGEFDPPEDF